VYSVDVEKKSNSKNAAKKSQNNKKQPTRVNGNFVVLFEKTAT
jgi:hypothetical protein